MKRIPRSKTLTAAAVGLSLVSALAGCASTTSSSSDSASSSTTPATSSSGSNSSGSTSASSTSDDSSSYKDGTYRVDESYQAPGGTDEIAATVTVKNSLVTSVTISDAGTSGEGARYIAQFASAIDSVAVGKSLRTLTVATLAGASLTTTAFNAALSSIRSDAA